MRRWLLSLFTVHFCICVVCFSIGHVHADQIRAQLAKAEAVQNDAPTLAGALADAFVETLAEADERGHGLVDGQIDAQEIIHSVTIFEFGREASIQHPFAPRERSSPVLKVLHRPPIAGLV
ncbi:MAG: hypothetical protein AB7L76_24580 [Burkholderiaceae bacterium]